jgi:beta-carotene ketolase (CrtO type)
MEQTKRSFCRSYYRNDNSRIYPNLKQIILKKASLSPIDYESKPSMSIRGTLDCGSQLPYQTKSMGPIPQLANYEIPLIENVYLCGVGSHPGPGVSMVPRRNAAHIILGDVGIDFNKLVKNKRFYGCNHINI